MFRSSRERQNVAPGARFRRPIGGLATELAEVLWVNEEPSGIPHVHYLVYFERGEKRPSSKERRTLSLVAFQNRYGQAALA